MTKDPLCFNLSTFYLKFSPVVPDLGFMFPKGHKINLEGCKMINGAGN